jgi:hypothetical protein
MCGDIVKFASVFTVAAGALFAQQSPPAQANISVGGKTVNIRYSAPSVRGRKIFGTGGLLSQDPTYPVWRAGANDATSLHTDADLEMGALKVPKGDYTLYCWVRDPDNWELIVNKQTGQSGLEYSASRDLGRVKMTMSKPATPIETMTFSLAYQGGGQVKIELAWEKHIASVIATVK